MFKTTNKIIRPIFNIYTAGENIQQLNNKINQLSKNKIYPIADYIKEFSDKSKDLKPMINEYLSLSKIENLEYIAIKLSSFCFEASDEQTIFKTEQTVRNCINKCEKHSLVVKDSKNKKIVMINPNLKVQTDGSILLDYKFFGQ